MFTRCVIFVYKEKIFCTPVRCCSASTIPLISSKRTKFNYRGEGVKKHSNIPLVSDHWDNKKSKGDYFTINSKPSKEPEVKRSFQSLGISPEILKTLSNTKINHPSTIQNKAIPIILSGKNSLIAAQTGCGKTLAYLLPLLEQLIMWKKIKPNTNYNSPMGLIISPNRVLAHQLEQVARPFCDELSLNMDCITGGHTTQSIRHSTMKEVDLVIASFGALSKMVTHRIYSVKNLHHVVLDEADTLLDDSFNAKLVHFLKKISFVYQATVPPTGSQLTLVSATMPTNLPEVLSDFIDVESLARVSNDYLHKLLPNVKQKFLRIGKVDKPMELLKLVRSDQSKRVPLMIFSNQTATSNWISLFLNEHGIKCIHLNSGMPVEMRNTNFELFKSGQVNIISCTDIGSRGLDTIRTKHVLNYEFPLYIADYIHRVGRTGRLGSPEGCHVTNFISSRREIPIVQKIETSVRKLKELPNVQGNITKVIYGTIMDNPKSSIKKVQSVIRNTAKA
ncbi:putative ATP-dependent RNA helicase Dbp21E2 [Arctopsyche grandis]|uniref:putative ATP-dependent RNA helicase Dbp21E2 n=1 Tax=Arctopsyche grandis TaxID=121162 RepID=UPI00406D71DF